MTRTKDDNRFISGHWSGIQTAKRLCEENGEEDAAYLLEKYIEKYKDIRFRMKNKKNNFNKYNIND